MRCAGRPRQGHFEQQGAAIRTPLLYNVRVGLGNSDIWVAIQLQTFPLESPLEKPLESTTIL